MKNEKNSVNSKSVKSLNNAKVKVKTCKEFVENAKNGFLFENIEVEDEKIYRDLPRYIECEVVGLDWKECLRGYCFEKGLIGKKDDQIATYWYALASSKGNKLASHELSKFYK